MPETKNSTMTNYWFKTPQFNRRIKSVIETGNDPMDGPTHRYQYEDKPKDDLGDRLDLWLSENTPFPVMRGVRLQSNIGSGFTYFDGSRLCGIFTWEESRFDKVEGISYEGRACIKVQPPGELPKELSSILTECGYVQY